MSIKTEVLNSLQGQLEKECNVQLRIKAHYMELFVHQGRADDSGRSEKFTNESNIIPLKSCQIQAQLTLLNLDECRQ